MNKNLKNILTYAGIVLVLLVVAYAFVPQVLGGKIVNQSDISGYVGMAHEMDEHNAAHPDDPTAWSNSMFGGMPTTVISAPKQGDWTQKIYDLLLLGKRPATYLFVSLLGAFLLLLSLGIDTLIAAGGAFAVTFCSYNLQIIQVGHNTKMQALAFLPWALAAMIFAYKSAVKEGEEKKKWIARTALGSVLFGLAVALQVKANHQQITYYLAILILTYAVALFIWLVADKERRARIGRFFVASALLLVMGLAGIATNANKLIPIFKYTPYSMRGGSELATTSDGAKGLDMDYATAWSYGWEELPNMLIPNFNGGSSSGAVNPDKSATYSLLKRAGQPNAREACKALPLYWGPQPFTAGPMYMGAITIFLFLLGLMLCKGKEKWWIVVCTVLAMLLALGSHFMWFTRLFYDHAPFYNKFRTVSMALVVLQFTLPMLGFLALDRTVKGGVEKKDFMQKSLVALAISGGFCLFCALIPSIAGSFSGAGDSGMQDVLVDALKQDRRMLLRSDAIRSLVLIAAAFLLLMWGYSVPKSAQKTFAQGSDMSVARHRTAALLVCFLVLVDLFSAGKRYLGPDDFVSRTAFKSQFAKRLVDEKILQDTDPSYRVLDLSVNTFNDSHPSYWHKCIGGYSPAKLQRTQELIARWITPEIRDVYGAAKDAATIGEVQDALPQLPVLNMLNTRYIVFGEDIAPVVNEQAYGNAWFVESAMPVSSPLEALEAAGKVDALKVAVLEPSDAACVGAYEPWSEGDSIEMTHYAANELRYHYVSAGPRLAVFSEVYYPEGWHAWLADDPEACPDVDASASEKARAAAAGIDVPVFRADWLLRAAVLPAGEHDLIMRFDPESYRVSAAISRASSISLIILLLLAAAGLVAVERKH